MVLLAFSFLAFSCESGEWVGTWTCGIHAVDLRRQLTNCTLRQIVRVSIGGSTVRVGFSNLYSIKPVTILSATIAISNGGMSIKVNSWKLLMFKDAKSVTIPAKNEVYSEPVYFPLKKNSLLAITISFGEIPSFVTGHFLSMTRAFFVHGSHVTDTNFNRRKLKFSELWVVIKSVEVDAKTVQLGSIKNTVAAATIVALGDSITDGRFSGFNKNNRWTDVLSERLLDNHATVHIGVLNVGINGNRVLSPMIKKRSGGKEGRGGERGRVRKMRLLTKFGVAAMERFKHDVLAQPGVRWLIVAEGVNDIGVAFNPLRSLRVRNVKSESIAKGKGLEKKGTEEEDRKEKADQEKASTIVPKLISAYSTMVNQAHAHGISVIGCTILPIGGSKYDTPGAINAVNKINKWIRESKMFDIVVDFHSALKSKSNAEVIQNEFHSGDYLHPNEAGYAKMGEAFELELFYLKIKV